MYPKKNRFKELVIVVRKPQVHRVYEFDFYDQSVRVQMRYVNGHAMEEWRVLAFKSAVGEILSFIPYI